MLNRYKSISFIFILGLLSLTNVFGQAKKGIEYSGFFDSYYFRGPVNFTAGGGLTTFNGDICKFFECQPSYYASIGASYQVWPRTYFGVELSYANLKGTRGDDLNYGFEHPVLQFVANGRFLLLDKKVTRHSQLKQNPYYIRPYITTGIGYVHSMNPTYTVNPDLPFLPGDTGTLGYTQNTFIIPAGIGFQIWFSHRVSIMPEFVYHFSFTDNLDGIYLESDQSNIDTYAFIGVKVQITPTAPRVRKKKKKLTPPDEYTGPKGTDYPRKREEEPAPQDNYQEYPDDNYYQQNDEQPENQDDSQQQDNDGWDDSGGWDDGTQEEQPQENTTDDWGW